MLPEPLCAGEAEASEASKGQPLPRQDTPQSSGSDSGEDDDVSYAERLLEQRWVTGDPTSVIFEEPGDEEEHHRRRSTALACFVKALVVLRDENDKLREAGQALLDDVEQLQEDSRKAAEDAAYWRSRAHERCNGHPLDRVEDRSTQAPDSVETFSPPREGTSEDEHRSLSERLQLLLDDAEQLRKDPAEGSDAASPPRGRMVEAADGSGTPSPLQLEERRCSGEQLQAELTRASWSPLASPPSNPSEDVAGYEVFPTSPGGDSSSHSRSPPKDRAVEGAAAAATLVAAAAAAAENSRGTVAAATGPAVASASKATKQPQPGGSDRRSAEAGATCIQPGKAPNGQGQRRPPSCSKEEARLFRTSGRDARRAQSLGGSAGGGGAGKDASVEERSDVLPKRRPKRRRPRSTPATQRGGPLPSGAPLPPGPLQASPTTALGLCLGEQSRN